MTYNVVQHREDAQRRAQQFADWLRDALAGPHDRAVRAELKKALRRTRLVLALLAGALATARVLEKRAQRRDSGYGTTKARPTRETNAKVEDQV
jgi:hypothetical protein